MPPRKNVSKSTVDQTIKDVKKPQLRYIDIPSEKSEITIIEVDHVQEHKKVTYTKQRMYEVFRSKNIFAIQVIQNLYNRIKDELLNKCDNDKIGEYNLKCWFEFCLFCFIFGSRNQLLGKKYQPISENQLFETKPLEALKKSLLGFFRYEKPTYKSQNSKFNKFSNSKSGLYDYLLSTQETEFDGGKIGTLLEGPYSSGKSTLLSVFSQTYQFEIETIDFSMYKSLRDIANKYQLAVVMNDVKMNLNNYQKSTHSVTESQPDKIMKFFKAADSITIPKKTSSIPVKRHNLVAINDQSPFSHCAKKINKERIKRKPMKKHSASDDESLFELGRIGNSKMYTAFGGNEFEEFQNRKKIYVCQNVEYLYEQYYLVNKKDFQRHFDKFLQFINLSSYPFIFDMSTDCKNLFSNSLDYFETIKTASFSAEEINVWIYIVITLEHNFREVCKELHQFRDFDHIEKDYTYDKIYKHNIEAFEKNVDWQFNSVSLPKFEAISELTFELKNDLSKVYSYLETNLVKFFEKNVEKIDFELRYEPQGYNYGYLYNDVGQNLVENCDDRLEIMDCELALLGHIDSTQQIQCSYEWKYPTQESRQFIREITHSQFKAK